MTSLYEIATQYQADVRRLEELDLDDQTFLDTLESLSGDLEVKAANVAMFSRNLEATAQAIKDAETQMYERRKRLEAKAQRIYDYLLSNMQACGIPKIESTYFALQVKKNPESVVVDFEGSVPGEFFTQPAPPPKKLDRVKLKEAIKSGLQIEGVHLESKYRLDIK